MAHRKSHHALLLLVLLVAGVWLWVRYKASATDTTGATGASSTRGNPAGMGTVGFPSSLSDNSAIDPGIGDIQIGKIKDIFSLFPWMEIWGGPGNFNNALEGTADAENNSGLADQSRTGAIPGQASNQYLLGTPGGGGSLLALMPGTPQKAVQFFNPAQ